jgi:hypothetical protein
MNPMQSRKPLETHVFSGIKPTFIKPITLHTHYQIIGFGPACISLLIAADRTGILLAMLKKGVIIHEKSDGVDDLLNTGINYDIPSNSDAIDFLSGIASDGLFSSVLQQPAAKMIRAAGNNAISLKVIAILIADIRQCFLTLLSQYKNSHVIYRSRVESIDQLEQEWSVCTSNSTAIVDIVISTLDISTKKYLDETLENNKTHRTFHHQRRVISPYIIIASGSYPYIPSMINQYCEQNSIPLLHSESVLRDNESDNNNLATHIENNRDPIVIVGASHSGFSVLHRLLDRHSGQQHDIDIIYSKLIRRMHFSEKEATDAGECFNREQDICPESGRVFRFQGLYKRSKYLFENVMQKNYPFISLHQCDQRGDIIRYISKAGIVISATGYRPRVPVVRNQQGQTMSLNQYGASLLLSDNGNICDTTGTPLNGLMAIGLGFGREHRDIGEPSYVGAPVGINIFQGADGDVICRQLSATSSSPQEKQYEEKLI